MTQDPVAVIGGLFASEGLADYLGEPVTQAAHMLQAAALAQQAGAPPALAAAALLHDVGHFTGTVTGHDLMAGQDNQHSDQGAEWLAQWFGPEVTEPVRLQVAAKRYLCAVEPGYLDRPVASLRLHPRRPGRPDVGGGDGRLRGAAVRAGGLPGAPVGR